MSAADESSVATQKTSVQVPPHTETTGSMVTSASASAASAASVSSASASSASAVFTLHTFQQKVAQVQGVDVLVCAEFIKSGTAASTADAKKNDEAGVLSDTQCIGNGLMATRLLPGLRMKPSATAQQYTMNLQPDSSKMRFWVTADGGDRASVLVPTFSPPWLHITTGPVMSAQEVVDKHNAYMCTQNKQSTFTLQQFLKNDGENVPDEPLFGMLDPSLVAILHPVDLYLYYSMEQGKHLLLLEQDVIRIFGKRFPPGVQLNKRGEYLMQHPSERRTQSDYNARILSWGAHTQVSLFSQYGDLIGYANDSYFKSGTSYNGGLNQILLVHCLGDMVDTTPTPTVEQTLFDQEIQTTLGEYAKAVRTGPSNQRHRPYIGVVGVAAVLGRDVHAGEYLHMSYNATGYEAFNTDWMNALDGGAEEDDRGAPSRKKRRRVQKGGGVQKGQGVSV
jgi:hypothetical protein